MRRSFLACCLFAMLMQPVSVPGQDLGQIDWGRARQLFQRTQRGETLEIVDLKYLERSRICAGNAKGALNPEPYAYESAFAARYLIQKQALKESGAPVLLWGPYLWSEGEKGRKMDDLRYVAADFAPDGVHPSPSGRDKVAGQLLEFFSTSPLAEGWFAAE